MLKPLNLAEQAELERLYQIVGDDDERAACEASLLYFVERAWQEIDPASLSINWHHEAICAHLQAVANGEVRNLIINIPPRHTKTLIVNVLFPAWVWARGEKGPLSGAHVKFLSVSYGATLAEEVALKMRRLVTGDWYQRLWGDRVQILEDQKSRANFGNSAGGERISNSIEGGVLGRGGDIKIIDDPQTRAGADSELERAASLRGMSDLTTRITDPRISAQILIMQRLHVNDATDWALKNWPEDTVHLMFPARYDPNRPCFADPRRERGELLWPEVWSDGELEMIERGLKALDGDRLSDYAVAGQLQQDPIPRGGGIIKREWIQPWPPSRPDGSFPHEMVRNGRIDYPALEYIVACVDTAFTKKQERDRSAMAVIGIFRAEGKGRIDRQPDGSFTRVADDYGFPKALLLYGWAKRLELHGPPDVIPPGISAEEWASPRMRVRRQESWGLVETVVDTCQRYKVDHLVILTLGQGHGLEQEMRRLHSDNPWGVSMEVERGDKQARAYRGQHLFSAGQFYAPQFEDGSFPTWCDPLIDELCLFPRGRQDDFVDAVFGALRHVRDTGLLERREEFDRAEDHAISWVANRRVAAPYDT